MNKIKQELRDMNVEQLQSRILMLKNELFVLRLNSSTAHIKDYSQFKKLRRALACAITYLNEKTFEESLAAFFADMKPIEEENARQVS